MNGSRTPTAAQRGEYQRHFTAAADALQAAIETRVTDGGETITHLLATVAANLGGLRTLTQARPGSWEAHHIDETLTSTVGADGEYLLEYRTHPIEIVECVELALSDAGVEYLYDDSIALIDAAEGDTGDATAERVERAEQLIEQLRQSDYTAYQVEYERHVHAAAEELVLTRHLPPSVPVGVRWVSWEQREWTTGWRAPWGTVELELNDSARQAARLPGFAPDMEPSGIDPAERLSAAGRLPHQRIPELAHYVQPTTEDEQDDRHDQ